MRGPKMTIVRVKADATPIDNIEKFAWYDTDFETVEEYQEISEIEFANCKKSQITRSKMALAKYLEEHPLLSDCHNQIPALYSITEEKQTLMMSQYMTYMIEKNFNPEAVIRWNATGEACSNWAESEFLTLISQIKAVVYPLVSRQQDIEIAINSSETYDDLMACSIDYEAYDIRNMVQPVEE